jgi:hypothetical protein
MPDYLLGNIPEETMRDFKTACAYFKETMREVLIRLMEVQIAAHRVDVGQYKTKRTYTKKKEK